MRGSFKARAASVSGPLCLSDASPLRFRYALDGAYGSMVDFIPYFIRSGCDKGEIFTGSLSSVGIPLCCARRKGIPTIDTARPLKIQSCCGGRRLVTKPLAGRAAVGSASPSLHAQAPTLLDWHGSVPATPPTGPATPLPLPAPPGQAAGPAPTCSPAPPAPPATQSRSPSASPRRARYRAHKRSWMCYWTEMPRTLASPSSSASTGSSR